VAECLVAVDTAVLEARMPVDMDRPAPECMVMVVGMEEIHQDFKIRVEGVTDSRNMMNTTRVPHLPRRGGKWARQQQNL